VIFGPDRSRTFRYRLKNEVEKRKKHRRISADLLRLRAAFLAAT
jgi:hypothetical protein